MKKNSQKKLLVAPDIKFCWVVALQCEAKPLIKFFEMKCLSGSLLYPIYVSNKGDHALVISGVGQIKAASASTFLREKLNVGNYSAWINIGVAGYFKGPIGTLYQIQKVVSQSTEKSFFPGLRFSKIVKGATLITVDQPERDYLSENLYDMEAAGFCEVAPLFSCNELTFVFKIVSDTQMMSRSFLKKTYVSEIIDQNRQSILRLVDAIDDLVQEEKNRLEKFGETDRVLEKFHFTESNRLKFERVFRQWRSIYPDRPVPQVGQKKSAAKEIIVSLEKDIADAAYNWVYND